MDVIFVLYTVPTSCFLGLALRVLHGRTRYFYSAQPSQRRPFPGRSAEERGLACGDPVSSADGEGLGSPAPRVRQPRFGLSCAGPWVIGAPGHVREQDRHSGVRRRSHTLPTRCVPLRPKCSLLCRRPAQRMAVAAESSVKQGLEKCISFDSLVQK